MKKTFSLLIITLTVLSCSVSHTNISEKTTELHSDIWTAFRDENTRLIGYKDKDETVKIEPKFAFVSPCDEFYNIIAVLEEIDGEVKNYHLTKTGKIAGIDSLYYFDNALDCETEGFIRFRDHKIDKAGLLDRNGNVAIPAEYDYLEKVINGVIVVLKGGEKKYSDPGKEHNPWIGGKDMLIDTLNNILIDNFTEGGHLDFFSMEKTKTPHPDTIRKSFLAKDGGYYSFIDFEKEFEQWLNNDLLSALTAYKFINAPADSIGWRITDYWEDYIAGSRGKINRQEFITDNFETLKKELLENPYISVPPFIYYEYSGNSRERIYPVIEVRNSGKGYNNCYDFLRTDKGYELINVGIRTGELKLNADIYSDIGNIYYDKQAYDEAIEYYQKAIKLKPDFATAYYYIGEAYIKKGDESKGLEYKNKAETLGYKRPTPSP